MGIEQIPGNEYHGDPSMPFFRYQEDEKAELMIKLLGEGMTEEEAVNEIVRREGEIINRQAQAKLEREQESAV